LQRGPFPHSRARPALRASSDWSRRSWSRRVPVQGQCTNLVKRVRVQVQSEGVILTIPIAGPIFRAVVNQTHLGPLGQRRRGGVGLGRRQTLPRFGGLGSRRSEGSRSSAQTRALLELDLSGLGFRVQGSGFRVQGSGFRV
jgi:hypothetical protein